MDAVRNRVLGFALLFVWGVSWSLVAQRRVIRVDARSPAFPHRADGSSWERAYTDLHIALAAASSGDQVWVASGTYPVAQRGDENPRDRIFQVKEGVELYGSFPNKVQATGRDGYDESMRNELSDRNYVSYPTTLTGDIDESGGPTSSDAKLILSIAKRSLVDGFSIKVCFGRFSEKSSLVDMLGGNAILSHCRLSFGRGLFSSSNPRSPGVTSPVSGSILLYCIMSENVNVQPGFPGLDIFTISATIVNCTLMSSGEKNVLALLIRPAIEATFPVHIQNTLMLSSSGGVTAAIENSQDNTEFLQKNLIVQNSYMLNNAVELVTWNSLGAALDIRETSTDKVTKEDNLLGGVPILDDDFRQDVNSPTKGKGKHDFVNDLKIPSHLLLTDAFGTNIPQPRTGSLDIGAHELVPTSSSSMTVSGFSPTTVFRGVDRSLVIFGSAFRTTNLSSNRVTFLGGPGAADDTFASPSELGSFVDRLLVEFPPNTRTGKIRVQRGTTRSFTVGVTSEFPLVVKEFAVTSFASTQPPLPPAYPGKEVELSGVFPSSMDPRLRVILPDGESAELKSVDDSSITFLVSDTAGERVGKLKVIFGSLEEESPWDFRILQPRLVSLPTDQVERGEEIVIQGEDYYPLPNSPFRVFFEGEEDPVEVSEDQVDAARSTLRLRVPGQAVSGHLRIEVEDIVMESRDPLNVSGHPVPTFGIEEFTEESFRSRDVVLLGTFSSIGNSIGFPNGRGGYVWIEDPLLVAPGEFSLTVPSHAFSGRLVLLTTGDQQFLTSESISILPKLSLQSSFLRGGAPGSKVTIKGSGFSRYKENNIVRVSGIETPVLAQTKTSLTFEVPKAARESNLSVNVLGEEVETFFPVLIVRIKELVDNPVEPGGRLLIFGFGFALGQNINEVTFLGDPLVVDDDVVVENLLGSYVTGDSGVDRHLGLIRVVPPPRAATGPVQVRVGPDVDVSQELFRFAGEPPQEIVITEIAPLRVRIEDVVVLRGLGFGFLPEHNRVFFRDKFGNDLEAEILSATPTVIRVRVPKRSVSGSVVVEVGERRAFSQQSVEIDETAPRLVYHTSGFSSSEQVLYPNPVRQGPLHCTRAFDYLRLYDMSMREVFSLSGDDYSSAAGIDLSFLSSGVYFATIRLREGGVLRVKLLKE